MDTKVGSDQFPVVALAVNAATMDEVEFFRENSFSASLSSSWLFSQKLCGEENTPLTRASASVLAEASLGGGSTQT